MNSQTVQRQMQEQKTTVSGDMHGEWIVKLTWSGIFCVVTLVGFGVILWNFAGLVGQSIDVSVVLLAASCGLYWLYHWAIRQGHITQGYEMGTHFYAHNESIIGDYTTREYVHFHPQIGQPKDETVETYTPRPDTWEQEQDARMYQWKKKEGLTYKEILGKFDEQLGMTISKIQKGVQRHEARIAKGEIND